MALNKDLKRQLESAVRRGDLTEARKTSLKLGSLSSGNGLPERASKEKS